MIITNKTNNVNWVYQNKYQVYYVISLASVCFKSNNIELEQYVILN